MLYIYVRVSYPLEQPNKRRYLFSQGAIPASSKFTDLHVVIDGNSQYYYYSRAWVRGMPSTLSSYKSITPKIRLKGLVTIVWGVER
jgi:hypothetical protein